MSTQRGVWAIQRIDRHVHLVPVKTPHRTAWTELLRLTCETTETPLQSIKGLKRWQNSAKTNLRIEKELLALLYPDFRPCDESVRPVQIHPNELSVIHSACEYDLELKENHVVKVHRIHKLPLTKKTMAPLISALASYHTKRKRGHDGVRPSVVRQRFGSYDWPNLQACDLKRLMNMCVRGLDSTGKTRFTTWMRSYFAYKTPEPPVKAFINNQAELTDVMVAYAQKHNELFTAEHSLSLATCKSVYRHNIRSTAFETSYWIGPWCRTNLEVDQECPICAEPMVGVSMTACGHGFCQACIKRTPDACALCRQAPQPITPWKKSLIWWEQDIYDREHAVRDALANKTVRWEHEPHDEDLPVVCATKEDMNDWENHFDQESVYLLEDFPFQSDFTIYQAHYLTLDQWEYLLHKWGDQRAVICGRIDRTPAFRGSLFRSLSGVTKPSSVCELGDIYTWDNRPPVEQIFSTRRSDTQLAHANLPSIQRVFVGGKMCTLKKRHPDGRWSFHETNETMRLDIHQQRADVISYRRWPTGRVDVGALLVTASTKECIGCALHRVRSLCAVTCHVICMDCPTPSIQCTHNKCKPKWRTTID